MFPEIKTLDNFLVPPTQSKQDGAKLADSFAMCRARFRRFAGNRRDFGIHLRRLPPADRASDVRHHLPPRDGPHESRKPLRIAQTATLYGFEHDHDDFMQAVFEILDPTTRSKLAPTSFERTV